MPRRAEDFGDGGAFPEIHVAQYPLDMGKGSGQKGNQQLAVTLNADGQINYDAIIKQGGNRDRVVHSDHKALVPKVDRLSKEVSLCATARRAACANALHLGQDCARTPEWGLPEVILFKSSTSALLLLTPPPLPDPVTPLAQALARPDDEEVEKTIQETAAALERAVQGKLSSVNPSKLPAQPGSSTLIKYTPAQQGPQVRILSIPSHYNIVFDTRVSSNPANAPL